MGKITCPKCGEHDPVILLQPKEHIKRERMDRRDGKEGKVVYNATLARKIKCCKCGAIDYLWHFDPKKYANWKNAKRGRPKKAKDAPEPAKMEVVK